MKYGFLLEDFTKTNTIPVFRTESQDRMLKSAQNFALGFFGWPLDGQYQEVVTIEAKGFNNTMAPYMTCNNAGDPAKSDRGQYYVMKWANKYLQDAQRRLSKHVAGYDLSIEDVYTMQETCAYETVALGYSAFCPLFTMEEWEAFDYSLDLNFWYNSAFGSPLARALGMGWVKELLARLSGNPISVHDSSTNSTLDDDPRTFPLNQSLYVDATHEVVVLYILTALGLDNFAKQGPLPPDQIPKNRTFKTSELSPFATNVQFQLLTCSASGPTVPQIRIIVNDGVVPLTSIEGCGEDADGLCDLSAFIKTQQKRVEETDWSWSCDGDWEVPEGDEWDTVTGEPPAR